MHDMLKQMVQWFRREDGFMLIAHVSPDGDTIGSCLALYGILRGLGKQAELVCEHIIPPLYRFMPGAEGFVKPDAAKGQRNVVAVDCAAMDRMGASIIFFEQAEETGNIDHHLSNDQYGKYVVHDTGASATAELVFALWQALEVEFLPALRQEIATCLFTGISTDTGNFSYANTTADTFRICASLTEEGIDLADINRRVYRTVPIGKARLRGFVLSTLQLHENGKIATGRIMIEDLLRLGACVEDIEGMVDGLRDIDTVEVAILIRERKEGGFKASLRSKEYVDVSKMAAKFGGGGHIHAAGCDSAEGEQVFCDALLQAAREALG